MAWSLIFGLALTATTAEGGRMAAEPSSDVPPLASEAPSDVLPRADPAPNDAFFVADEVPSEPLSLQDELPSALSQHVRASIRLGADLAMDTMFDSRTERVFELSFSGRLELDASIGDSLKLFVAPQFLHVTGLDRYGGDREVLYLNPPESFATYSAGPFHLRAGLLIFSWGASDIVAPQDVLNPVDLRRGALAQPEALKIPVLAAEAVLSIGPLTMRGVIEPVFTPSRFFLQGWDSAVGLIAQSQGIVLPNLEGIFSPATIDRSGDLLIVTQQPSDRIENGTFGGRATFSQNDLELSATLVHGFEPLPRLRFHPDLVFLGGAFGESLARGEPLDVLDPDLLGALDRLRSAQEAGLELIISDYQRRTVIGFDLVYALDPVILKLDVAYTLARTLYTQRIEPVRHPWLNSVFGVEYLFGEELQIIIEAFVLTVIDVPSYYRILLLEPGAPPPSQFDLRDRTIAVLGLSGVIRYSLLDGDLELDLAAAGTLSRGDLALLPAVRYKLDDHQLVRLNAMIIQGPADGYGGVYSHNDQLMLGYQWSY